MLRVLPFLLLAACKTTEIPTFSPRNIQPTQPEQVELSAGARSADCTLRHLWRYGAGGVPLIFHYGQKTENIADQLGLKTYRARRAPEIALGNLVTFDKKQQDYGANDISANPYPELGVAIRANDKVQRLMNLLYSE